MDGELEMTWDELVEGGYIELGDDGATLKDVQEGLHGRLVVSEDITAYGNVAFNGSQLEEIWSPCTVPETNGAFGGARELKTVRFFGDLQELNYKCFSGCVKLESVVIPDSVRIIPDQCFSGCAALTSVTLPADLEVIDTDAFSGTAALAHLDFPRDPHRDRRRRFLRQRPCRGRAARERGGDRHERLQKLSRPLCASTFPRRPLPPCTTPAATCPR